MPLMGHLRELRRRLMYIVAALVVGMVLSLPATVRVMRGLQDVCPLC